MQHGFRLLPDRRLVRRGLRRLALAAGRIGVRCAEGRLGLAARAHAVGRLVGFKAGYATGRHRYYSWLGGEQADFRRRGIAAALMRRQHAWLRERGFETVETAANQDNLPMIGANLEHGFTVCGLRQKAGRVQVLFSKDLR